MCSILLVDDDAMTAEFMVVFLQSEGHSVTVCTSIAEALSLLGGASFSFELLLTDLKLPDGNGSELACLASKVAIPSIAITGFGKSDIDESDSAKFFDILVKPVDLEVLKIRMMQALDHQRPDEIPKA